MTRDNRLDLRPYFVENPVNLGDVHGGNYDGIYSPAGHVSAPKKGVTEQFLANAETYHQKYFNTEHFERLLTGVFERVKYEKHDPEILDIGSGSGNTIFPLMKMFPAARIVATDISPDLLAIMKKIMDEAEGCDTRRLGLACVDVADENFRDEVFDLAVGSAILHHILDPAKCVRAAMKSIKRDGLAIFFEPFETGYSIVKLAYRRILERAERRKSGFFGGVFGGGDRIDPKTADFLRALIHDYDVRSAADKSDKLYEHLDDKWLFTRRYFYRIAEELGLRGVTIYSLRAPADMFTVQTERNLKFGIGAGREGLPAWAWEIIAEYDAAFSDDAKDDLLCEGCVILKK